MQFTILLSRIGVEDTHSIGEEPKSTELSAIEVPRSNLAKGFLVLFSTDIAPIAFGEPAKKRHGYQSTET
jgi:hypothetical protein